MNPTNFKRITKVKGKTPAIKKKLTSLIKMFFSTSKNRSHKYSKYYRRKRYKLKPFRLSLDKFKFKFNKKYKLNKQAKLNLRLVKQCLKRIRRFKAPKLYKYLKLRRNNLKLVREFNRDSTSIISTKISDPDEFSRELFTLRRVELKLKQKKYIRLYKFYKKKAIWRRVISYARNIRRYVKRVIRFKKPKMRFYKKRSPYKFKSKVKFIKSLKIAKSRLIRNKKKKRRLEKEEKARTDLKLARRLLIKKMLFRLYQPEIKRSNKKIKNKFSIRNRPLRTLFINILTTKGRKQKFLKKFVQSTMRFKKKYRGNNFKKILHTAIKRIKTSISFRNKKVGSMNYKVPIPISKLRSMGLAVRTLIKYSRLNTKKLNISDALFNEIDTSRIRSSSSWRKRVDIHKLGLDSRPYLQYYKAKKRK